MPKNNNYRLLIFVLISSIGYLILGYFTTRDQTSLLFLTYLILFVSYISSWIYSDTRQIKRYIYAAIGLRVLLLLSIPSLSDDIYRFIWDGRLLANGISPFAALPIDYINTDATAIPGIDPSLFQLLNSPEYFTAYPPLSQVVFWISVLISPDSIIGSILVMRVLILLVEAGSIILITKLLAHYKLPGKNVLLYALNPLVIIELSSNLHFEAFVIFFLLLAIYLITQRKFLLSGISWSFAIGFKLIPLIFLPLAFRRFSFRIQIILYASIALATLLIFLPLYDQSLIDGLSSSLALYFQKFEFNASIYYLIREVGFWVKGYNIIAQLGSVLGLTTFGGIMVYCLIKKQQSTLLPVAMMWSLLIYLTLATTVHPWYITTLVGLSLFSTYRFPILWSLLIFLTYAGYSASGYTESMYLVAIEYILLTGFICYELYQNKTTTYTSTK